MNLHFDPNIIYVKPIYDKCIKLCNLYNYQFYTKFPDKNWLTIKDFRSMYKSSFWVKCRIIKKVDDNLYIIELDNKRYGTCSKVHLYEFTL